MMPNHARIEIRGIPNPVGWSHAGKRATPPQTKNTEAIASCRTRLQRGLRPGRYPRGPTLLYSSRWKFSDGFAGQGLSIRATIWKGFGRDYCRAPHSYRGQLARMQHSTSLV